MKIKKGGYAVKNGFYIKNDIKNDCKNNDEDGSLDEDGYILDPLTYDRIKEGNLIQLSDGICYEKSKNLTIAIKNRNTLPFGHDVTSVDKKKLSLSQNQRKKKRLIIESSSDFDPDQELEDVLRRQTSSPEVTILSETTPSSPLPIPSQTPSSEEEEFEITPVRRTRRPVQINIPTPRQVVIPPRPNVPGFTSEWHPATQSYILRREPTVINRGMTEEAQPEIIPAPRRRGRPLGSRNRTTRQRPTLIIESGSPDSMEAQPENTPSTRRRGRPPGSRNRTTRQRPTLIIESDSPEEIGNSGRGTKKRNLKRKSKGKSKRKSK